MGLHHSPRLVTTNLSLMLDPSNTKSYPGSGTTWYDLSGNGNNAALTGSPTFSGGTVTWNGSSQYATVTANETSLGFADDQTIMMWIYPTTFASRQNPWNQAYGGYGTMTQELDGRVNYYYGTAGTDSTPYTSRSTDALTVSTWYCICHTRSVSTVTWYINAVQFTPAANAYGTTGTTAGNIRVGHGYAGYWTGQMGPVIAYKRALTADEVLQNFNAHRGRFGI